MWYASKLGLHFSSTPSLHLYYHLGVAISGLVHAFSSALVKSSIIGVRGSDAPLKFGYCSKKNAEVGVVPGLIGWLIDHGDAMGSSESSLGAGVATAG